MGGCSAGPILLSILLHLRICLCAFMRETTQGFCSLSLSVSVSISAYLAGFSFLIIYSEPYISSMVTLAIFFIFLGLRDNGICLLVKDFFSEYERELRFILSTIITDIFIATHKLFCVSISLLFARIIEELVFSVFQI
jgi:hypothetical protein